MNSKTLSSKSGATGDALLLVDIQNDFLPGGSLPVPHGDEVIAVANQLQDHFELVVATQDWHPPNHQSFAANWPGQMIGDVVQLGGLAQVLWAIHCVEGSRGAALAEGLDTSQIGQIVRKGTQFDIDSYSGFFDNGRRQATGLEDHLRHAGVSRLFVMGLATDYCVKATVLDALQLGFETWLVEDGCRGVDLKPGDVHRAISQMCAAGLQVTTSQAILAARDMA